MLQKSLLKSNWKILNLASQSYAKRLHKKQKEAAHQQLTNLAQEISQPKEVGLISHLD